MIENERSDESQDEQRESATGPPGGRTHEATTPPGQGDLDQEAAERAEDELDQAGGGH